jgi:MoxR-like ATPase
VYVDDLIQEWIVNLVRVTRDHELVAIGASVRGSLALERAARGWALLNERAFVVPADVERLFGPVLLHRIVFRPGFLAEARRDGWPAASERFRQSCLEAAPKPEAQLDGSVVPLGH